MKRSSRISRSLFHKLLHSDYRLDINQLGRDEVKILVALLEQRQAIRRIVDLFEKKVTNTIRNTSSKFVG